METHAKLGTNNHHRSMETHQQRNQIMDLKVTCAETQTGETASGVTPQTRKLDGSTVIQSSLVIFQLVQVKKTFQEKIRVEHTEVLREKPKKVNNAYHGHRKDQLNINTNQKDTPRMISEKTSAETQVKVLEQFGAGPA